MRTTTARTTAWLASAVIAAAAPAVVLAGPVVTSATPGVQPARAQVPSTFAVPEKAVRPSVLASQTQDTQTLGALYALARQYDAPYRTALAQVRASDAAVSEAHAALLPQVGFQAGLEGNRLNADAKAPITVGVNPLTGLPVQGQSMARNYAKSQEGFNATQALYRPADKIAWDQAKRQLDIAKSQLAAAQQDLIVRLAQAYFDVLAAQDTLRYLRTLKASVNRQLALARRNFEIGNANITDSRESEARLAMTRAQEIAAENDLHVKQLALEQLVGKAGVHPRPLADDPANSPTSNLQDVTTWAAHTANAPAVRQARQALEVARLEVDKAKTGNRPTLDLQASVGREQDPTGNPMGSIAAGTGYTATLSTIGVQLTWPLFTGGAVTARERETQALKDKAQAELDNALRSSTQATRAAYFNLQSGLEQVAALETAQGASQAALQANQLGYKVGARTNIDVLAAQSQLFESQRDLADARYNTLIGLLRLKQAAGVLTSYDLLRIDTLLAH